MIPEKRLKAECMDILQQHSEILEWLINDEKHALERQNKIGETEFETVRKVIMNEGIKRGMERLMERINEAASKQV